MKTVQTILAACGCLAAAALPSAALAETSQDEIRAIVSEMMADANTRSSLLQSGGNAGHDGMFFLADSEGNFRLNVTGQVQFRYIGNVGNANNLTDGGDYTGGFQTTRTKLEFTGNAVLPNLIYRIQGNFAPTGGFALQDAYVGYAFDNGLTFLWGQFKAPLHREELVDSKYQLAVDRSFANSLFSPTRTQGVAMNYRNDDINFTTGFTDGANALNTDFTSDSQVYAGIPTPASVGGGEADWAFTARLEWKLAGEWGAFKDFTSMAGSEFAAMLGVAAHYEGNSTLPGFGVGTTADVKVAAYTADLSLEGDGWNFFTAFMGFSSDYEGLVDIDGDAAADNVSFTDLAVIVQGGVFIPDTDWEFFGRWDGIFLDNDRPGGDNFNTVTFGLNWYWAGHAAKFTLETQVFLDESLGVNGVPLAAAAGGLNTFKGFVGDDDSGEVVIRAQFQLLF